ncbi:kinesin-like protein KIF26A isoform X1 [Silurus meridionalis]|uniref:kinesin-like protein KIF26A isoform X1 n=1 Tax=Silurus meridionalis TaxID=175797 RepID=UPI001EEB731B|nr:kinesin-like protein KIF26A isoform X1 [Silurus meridionalis]
MDPLMASLSSSPVPQKENLTHVDPALLHTDGIFGSTCHLLKRKKKVLEGSERKESPHYGRLSPRKKLHSADEIQCGRRPNPEGAGSVSVSVRELGPARACQRCHIITNQLHRQALALAEAGARKDPGFDPALLLDKLQALEWPQSGQGSGSCKVCGTPLHQLRRLALHSALGLSLDGSANLERESLAGQQAPHFGASSQRPFRGSQGSSSSTIQIPSRNQTEPATCIKRKEMGWIKSGAAGVDIKPSCHAIVTPLPIYAQQYLEGVWSVTTVSRSHQQQRAQGLAPEEDNVTSRSYISTIHSVALKGNRRTSQVTTAAPEAPQSSSAASFFIRAAQKLNLSKRKKPQPPPPLSPPDPDEPFFYTEGFSVALQLSPPPVPPCLLRAGAKVKDCPGMGKVKVMVRICPAKGEEDTSESMSFLKVDAPKKQLTFCEPLASSAALRRFSSTVAPKTFNFDAVFTQDASQAEVCSGTVAEVIQSVVNGADGCIFCFGHAHLGKTYTMIGKDSSTQSLGVAPCAISWLFKLIEERKEKAGARFSVRVSAVEISGRDEALTDLLADFCTGTVQGAGVYLKEDPLSGSQLQNQSELRASSAERAAFFLDSALAARSTSRAEKAEEQQCNSHMLFTLHVTQYRMEKSTKGGMSEGRSRLHLLDLGSCESDVTQTRDGGGGQCLSLAALGNVILALVNGAKHVPYRDSKLTMLLRESLGNINCRTTMIAHISDSPASFAESLSTVQLASRIHRMRKKKSKYASSSSGGESSCEEGQTRRPPHLKPLYPRTVALDPDHPALLSSDPDYSSSSEHSCDTVIYVGPGGAHISDRELSDNEGPPAFVPIIPSLNKKRSKEAPKSDGDHLKCNTFAELQERLECIDGSESTATFIGEGKGPQTVPKTQVGAGKATEGVLACSKMIKSSLHKLSDMEHLKKPSDEVVCSQFSAQDAEPVVREKVFEKGSSPLLQKTSNLTSDSILATRAPPVGMSQPALRQGVPHHLSRSPVEVSHLRAAFQSRCLERDVLRTTITLQQPVELNGEDEIVFTVVEELPTSLIPDNGRPSSIISFNSDCSRQAMSSGSRPVSIISSINDEFDAYVSQVDIAQKSHARSKDAMPSGQSTASKISYLKKTMNTNASYLPRDISPKEANTQDNISTANKPGALCMDSSSQQGANSSFNGSTVCFSELYYQSGTSEKIPTAKCPPPFDTNKTAFRGQRSVKSSTIITAQPAQMPNTNHSTLPKKNKPTSSVEPNSSFSRVFQRQGSRTDEHWMTTISQVDLRSAECISPGKPPKSVMSGIPSRKTTGGGSSSIPRSAKMPPSSFSHRVVDGCEKSSVKKEESLSRMPQLRRGATTLGMITVPHSSSELKWGHDAVQTSSTLKYSSLGKRPNGQKSSLLPKSGSMSPPAPPIRKSSLDQRTRTLMSPSALRSSSNDTFRSSSSKATLSEEDFDVRVRAESFSFKSFSLKSGSSPRGAKGDSRRFFGSHFSLERCDSLTSIESKQGMMRESSSVNLGGNSKLNRMVPRLGVTSSISTPLSPPSTSTTEGSKFRPIKANLSPRAIVGNGNKTKTLSSNNSKPLSATKSFSTSNVWTANLPPSGKPSTHSVIGASTKPGKGTLMGTKQAIRAANSRVSELASSSSKKPIRGPNDQASASADSGPTPKSEPCSLPSPYSKITAPRRPQRYSSGHGSDNSSVLSGELPPAMGRTALFYHSGGSSGYESMIRDSETTGSASSTHDSMSESGVSTSSRTRVSKSPKKRANGLQRRRLIPAPLPDSTSPGRKAGAAGQWVDLPQLGGSLKDAFEIKVYEIDDMERLQRCKEGMVTEGLQYFSARLRMLEKRQQQIRELRTKHERLRRELEDAKTRLMLDPEKWAGEFDVDPDLDPESHDFLEALVQATAELEFCVNLCKSRVMMETCFDILAPTSPGQKLEV